jgi:nitrite reductase/ring-hydroxylating ferredoxin subunit
MSISVVNFWSWYPIASSHDLQPGAVMPTTLHDERLVIWRSKEGRIGVWNDRCPHRGMSLSFGTTKGESLICPYHGWEFASEGSCRRIPAHPGLTPSQAVRTRVYPAAELANYVWACLGEPESAVPQLGLLSDQNLRPLRSMYVPVDAETGMRILLSNPLTASGDQSATYHLDGKYLSATQEGETGPLFCSVQLGMPPAVVCRFGNAGRKLHYAALVQPVGENTAVIHLASDDDATEVTRFALNDALVHLRSKMTALARDKEPPELAALIATLNVNE